MRFRFLAVALAAMLPLSAHATESDGEVWTSFWVHGPVKDKLLVSVDVSVRTSDRGTSAPTFLVRPLMGVQATKALSLWAGYTYVESAPNNRPDVREHRFVQQTLWNIGKVGKGALLSRTRVELRWVEGRQDTGVRLRSMLRFTQPLGTPKGPSLALSSEPFVNLNSTDFGQAAGFDQIRNFIGITVPVAKGLAIEPGYMNRYVRRKNAEDRMDHIASVTAVYRL